jgi:phage gpG-like protein
MLTITVDSKLVMDKLNQIQKHMADLTPAMEAIGQELESRISGRFETRTDPMGTAWDPWKPSTRENYPDDGRGLVLQRHGDMLKSLSFSADRHSARVGFGAVASKNGDVYAVYHEFGTKNMVRRGLLFSDPEGATLAPDDEAAVLEILDTFLIA